MTSQRLRFLGLLLFIASQTLAAEKPSPSVKRNFPSQQQEGLIGITEALPLDNPADNIFHVTIDEQVCAEDKVWLVYELDGVEDHSNVARSVNDQLAVGGYVVKKRRGWALQREELNGEWLKQGDNVVRFTLPSSANHSYRVKNLRVEIEKGAAENDGVQVVFNQPTATHYQSKAYIKGFVRGDVSAVRIGGKNILFTGGEFESLIDLTLIENSCTVDVEVVSEDGSSSCHAVNFSESAHADYIFTRDGVYYEAETFFTNKEKQNLELHGAHLALEEGALQAPSFLSITTLRDVDIPALDAGMVNVTAQHAAFRFLPNGTKFGKDVKLTIPFDTKQIPDGYTEQDIKTYYFDEQNHHWVPVPTDTVLLETGLIVSNTTHFTDYINAIIKVPESPEVNAYNSTSMKGIKAANPTAAVNLINPPQANNSGSASLGYPINIPAGRAGMQPQLNVSYNSGGGNGWMGLGWNLTIPSISIDTRWGVPRYDSINETETYSLNGEQLSPVAHRGEWKPRVKDKMQFYPRVEGAFNRIERFGDTPSNYYWVVTDKSGTKYFYGASGGSGNGVFDKDAVLRTKEGEGKGNISQWCLREVRDLRGNTVRYHYVKIADTGVKDVNASKGYQIYIERINYTGFQGSDGLYSIHFEREQGREDKIILANLGFKQVTGERLKSVRVKFNNSQIRSYEFEYTTGAFLKSLLSAIKEFDADNNLFTTHELKYYDDVNASSGYFPLGGEEKFNTHSDDVNGGFLNKGADFNDKASALSGTQSRTIGGGFSVTAGPMTIAQFPKYLFTKTNSAGIAYSHNNTNSEGRVQMVDITGDGLPDKVIMFKQNTDKSLMYRPQVKGSPRNTFGSLRPVKGINQFLKEVSSSNDFGIESHFGVFAGVNYTLTKSTTSIYFTDGNGDGLIDIVKDGKVYYNRLDENGDPGFYDSSTGTPNEIFTAGEPDKDIFSVSLDEINLIKEQNPLQDMVRMWLAPYDGEIQIQAPVNLIQDFSNERNEYATADGVKVSIQLKDNILWQEQINADDYSQKTPAGLKNIMVKKGDKLFFRLQSIEDGSFDQVIWNPVIEYTLHNDTIRDANGKHIYKFEAKDDYLLTSNNGWAMPITGKVNIEGTFFKPVTSDTVTVEVVHKTVSTSTILRIFKYSGDSLVNAPISISGLQVSQDDQIQFNVKSSTNIKWNQLKWLPHIYYTESQDPAVTDIKDEQGKYIINAYPTPNYSIFQETIVKANEWVASTSDTLTVLPSFGFRDPFVNGEITFTVKTSDSLFLKYHLIVKDSIVTDKLTGTAIGAKKIYVEKGQKLFFEYHTSYREVAQKMLSPKGIVESGAIGTVKVIAGLYTTINPDLAIFGPLYRQWGQFSYLGNDPYGNLPIDQSKLNVDNLKNQNTIDLSNTSSESEMESNFDSSNGNRANKNAFGLMYPDARKLRWTGNDDLTYVHSDTISSSRMGLDQISSLLPELSQGTAGKGYAVDKITKSSSVSLAVSASVGGNSSTGNSRVITDFVDMNGDRYPDILGEYKIQYTLPGGGLEKSSTSHDWEFGHQTNMVSGGVTIGGSFVGSGKEANGNAKTSRFSALGKASSFNVGAVYSDDKAEYSWVDINGDGLPDRVNVLDNKVHLNLGYSFAPAESWGNFQIRHGSSLSASGGLGVNIKNGSWQAGIGFSRSDNYSHEALQDVNGDGLLDKVVLDKEKVLESNEVWVYFNTGNGFAATPVKWGSSINRFGKGVSTSWSANVASTFGIPIFTPAGPVARININPKVNYSQGFNREQIQLSDIDGDGFPDYLVSTEDNELLVRKSTIGRTNMLKEVVRPLGATFSMNYHQEGNTYEHSNNTWVLDEVIVRDGFSGDGVDSMLTSFEYAKGYYDRHERDFYGFEQVISKTHDAGKEDMPVYTQVVQTFNNKDYYKKGLLLTEVMTDGAGNKYVEKVNTYAVTDVMDGVKFPALTKTEQKFYEGQSSPGKSTSSTYQYNAIGNVIAYSDKGDEGDEDNLNATITYHDIDGPYIKGTPKSILVAGNGTTYRRRETVIDPATGEIKQIKQYLSDSEVAVHDMEYDTYGNLTKITRPANSKGQRMSFNYEYDNTVFTYTTKVSNSYGYSSEALYDFKYGQVLKSIDLNGHEITYELDALGRVVSVTGPYEKGGASKTISFEYHPEDEVPWALTNHYDPANPKNNMQTSIFVDGLGRVLQTKKDAAIYDGEGKPDKEMMVVSGRVKFDAFGRTISALYPITEELNNQGDFNYNEDNVKPTITEYDVLNRTLKVTLPDLSVTSTAYGFESDRNGKKQFSTKTTDANGKQTEQFTDVRGRVTSVKNYTSTDPVWTSFKYNAINEQIEATDDLGHTTFSTYDNFGRRIERKHPDAGITQYSYDLAGNLKELVTANLAKEGGAITYAYDFERLTAITYPHNPENNVKYTYGAMGATDNRAGRIVTQEDASGAQEFFYGPLGEVVKNIRTVVIPQHDEQTYTTEWTYDTWNRLTSMTYADGEKVDYTYNVGGLLRSMSGKKKSESFAYVNQLGYDKFEQRVFLAYGNGTKTTYTYEEDRRRLKNMTAQTAAKRLFMDNAYEYDKVNNILSLKNNAPIPNANLMGGASEYSYAYDDLYRLTSAQGSYKGANDEHTYALAMSYNSVGGITQKVQNHQRKGQEQKKTSYNLNYTYSENQPHAPVHIGENAYTYDANGNQTGWTSGVSGQRRQVMWDEENRIRAIQDNGSIYHYIYDASGERVLKGKSTGQRVFVNGEWNAGSGGMGNYTVYVNPYLVLKSGGYTKHYYIEGQRIVSKLGSGMDTNGKGPLKAGGDRIDYAAKGQRIFDGIVKNLKFLGADGQILTAGKSGKIPPGQINGGSTSTAETFRYFYHPDHLGSTSYITDASGEVYQHLEYMAFGETFVEEHSNTERTPYLFNGKELDEETGLYYYGARYYDARTSVWVSVDALSDYQTGWSPYVYANNSPIVFIDPDGKMSMKWPPEFWEKHGTRIMGGLKAIGGAAEMVAGGAAILTPEPTMVTKVVGVAAVAHGSDTFSAGIMQLWTGQDQSTLTSQGLQAAGLSKENADMVDGGISIALTGGAGTLAKTPQLSSTATVSSNAAQTGTRLTVQTSDDMVSGVIQYSNGHSIDLLANKTVSGKTLELTDMIFYPKGVQGNELKNVFGSKMMTETLEALKTYAKGEGFTKLRLQFQRAANSSSASPGKIVDITLDL